MTFIVYYIIVINKKTIIVMSPYQSFLFMDAQIKGINEQIRNDKLNVSDEEFVENVNEFAKEYVKKEYNYDII